MLIWMVFVIIWEMFHEIISLNSVLLLLLVTFGSRFKLEFVYIFHIENIRPSLILLHGSQMFVVLECFIEIIFFCSYQNNKSSESKEKFWQFSIHCKSALEALKLAYANKTKSQSLPRSLALQNIWQIANSVLNNGKLATALLFNGLELLSSASDKAKLFTKNFSKNYNIGDLIILIFLSRTNWKLRNISVTLKMVKGS